MKNKTLSIIIPVYNEEETVIELLNKVLTVNLSVKKEIIIVNDGSTDSSLSLIEKWKKEQKLDYTICVISKKNGGKGSAVRVGIENSTGDVVIIQDADLEYDPNDYQKCINPILNGETKVIYGSRELCKNRDYSYLTFYAGGLLLTYWMNLLYDSEMTDEPTCYKTFDGNLLRKILFKGNHFEWEPEITAKVLRLGYKINEVSINYKPRHKEEGKKIGWVDGVSGLWTALYWRFAPLKEERNRILSDDKLKKDKTFQKGELKIVALIFFITLFIRVLFILPEFNNLETVLFRPDTSSYLKPALSLLENGVYNISANSNTPALLRVPGFPAFIALIFYMGGGIKSLAIILSAISALSAIFVYKTANYFLPRNFAIIASALFALNITSIAHSPMILSDTFLTFFIVLQLFFFIRFYKIKRCLYFFISIVIAGVATLIRPVNMLWILPAVFILLSYTKIPLKRRFIVSFLSVIIFVGIQIPWMYRNNSIGAGFRLDSLQGEILYHNGAVLLSKINNTTPSEERIILKNITEKEFKQYPKKYKSENEKIQYKLDQFKILILKYPTEYAKLHFRPSILIPDAATFFEVLGLTKTGGGTFDVLNKKGLFPAIKHYFKGKMWLILLIIPLLTVVLITYLGCFYNLLYNIWQKNWIYCLICLAFVEYYLFLPGPITMPRYHLPALPFMCIMAAITIFQIKNKCSNNAN